MKSIKDVLKSRCGFAVISNLITLLVSVFLFRPFWEESDDIGIALIAEGAYGYHEPHLIYSNIIYGKILCFFSGIIPSIRWHAVFEYIFTFFALTVFVYLISKDKKGRMLALILEAASFYEVYVALQFSKIATFVAILSYFILFEITGSDMSKKQKGLIASAAVLFACYAEILRLESFLLATMIAGCYGICLVVYEFIKGELTGRIRSYLACFIPVFVMVAVLFAVDRYAYSDGEWKDYIVYQDAASQMVDYHNSALLYDQHVDALNELGISENDALMYITYQTLEARVTTVPLMKQICLIDPKGMGSIDMDLIKAWVANIYDELFDMNSMITGFLMIAGIFLASAFNSRDRRLWFFNAIIQALLVLGILFYYQYSGRWCHRIVFALLVAEFVLIIYMLNNMDIPDTGAALKISVIIMIGVSVLYLRLGNEFAYQENKRSGNDYGQIVSYMQENSDRLFVTDVFTMSDYGRYNIFRAARFGQFQNCLQTDSVLMSNSPINRSIAGKFGYIDQLDALSSRSADVILVDALSPEVELTFCNEHGDGGEYHLNKIDTVGGVDLYNIL